MTLRTSLKRLWVLSSLSATCLIRRNHRIMNSFKCNGTSACGALVWKSNYVFHRANHHHLEPNFPIRFASNVGDKIVKNGRVYVKRIVDAFSFTVSLSLTNRDKADVELQSPVAPAEVGTVYVDNLPESQVFLIPHSRVW